VRFHSFASLGAAFDHSPVAPDVVLLDLHLDGIDGHDAIPLIRLRWPGTAVIVVTAERSRTALRRVIDAGASDVVMKSDSPERFSAVLRTVLGPGSDSVGDQQAPALSRRQIEVLHLLGSGHSNKAIAKLLDISEFTVRGHVQQILKTLQAASRAQAVFHAQNLGLL